MARLQRLRNSICVVCFGASGAFFSTVSNAQESNVVPNATSPQTQQAWMLRLPADQKVSFAGQVNLDAAGMTGGAMLYPAPGVAGLFAAVLTHGAIVEAAKKEQKEKLQQSANAILDPYQETLGGFTHQELAQLALARPSLKDWTKLYTNANPLGDVILLESSPRFLFTQDLSAIILENEITINKADGSSPASHRSVVRVISTATVNEQATQFWLAESGKQLKQKSAALLAESLDIALTSFAARAQKNEAPHRTFRYMEGNVEKVERGQFLSARCNRTVVTSLRGTFISFPARHLDLPASETTSPCSPELASVTP